MDDINKDMGINLSKALLARIATIVLMIVIIWGCGKVPRVGENPPPASRLPFVRVLLDESSTSHTIASDGGEMAIDCYKNNNRYSFYSRQPIVISGEKDKLALFTKSGNTLEYGINRIVVSARGNKRILSYDNKRYRGLFEMTSSSGQVKLINIVYTEDYLLGVVPLEIGPTPKEQIEAVKAQAVAARTYAMDHLGQYGSDAGYDLRADITDQVYGGVAVEVDGFEDAIKSTRGIVRVYNDEMINAYYHSTCGGTTDDIEDVWDKDARPYLKMVNDNDACEISKYFTWSERFMADQLTLRIEQYLSREKGTQIRIGELIDIRILGRTPGGRTAAITFETTLGNYTFNKEKVRWVIKRSNTTSSILRSANFDVDIIRDKYGSIKEVILSGHGYGHGVGMCQMGAKGLAKDGADFDSILSLYYQGTSPKRLY